MRSGVESLNFEKYRKSEDQVEKLANLYAKTTFDESTFRGSAQLKGLKRYFKKTNKGDFVQYRSGLQNKEGANSDISKVEPKTQEWKYRMARVDDGIAAVSKMMYAGASVEDLNKKFHESLDPQKDRVYGNVVNLCGYRGIEDTPIGSEGLVNGQMYTLGAAISSDGTVGSHKVGFHYPTTVKVSMAPGDDVLSPFF